MVRVIGKIIRQIASMNCLPTLSRSPIADHHPSMKSLIYGVFGDPAGGTGGALEVFLSDRPLALIDEA